MFGRESWREPWRKPCRKHCLKHCLTCVMRSTDAYFEACRVFDKELDREFDVESWRVLSIELISMCYEACMKHTMK